MDENRKGTLERLAREVAAVAASSRGGGRRDAGGWRESRPGGLGAAVAPLFDRPPPSGALHEIVGERLGDRGAATGFALALAASPRGRAGRVLWIADAESTRELGPPHGPGLAAFGLDPDRVLLLAAPSARDALWAAEEGLTTSALAAVLVELTGAPKALDGTAVRRLKLRAEVNGVAGLVLRHGSVARADAGLPVDLRWRVAAARSDREPRDLVGPPAMSVDLVKNRFGRTGHVTLAWEASHARLVPHVGDRVPAPRPGSVEASGDGGSRARA